MASNTPIDYVVGHYDNYGKKVEEGHFRGGDIVASQHKERMAEGARKQGALPLEAPAVGKKKGRGKGKKTLEREALTAVEPIAAPAQRVIEIVFVLDSSRIKVISTGVVINDNSILLVFKSTDDIHCEPTPGHKFEVIIEGQKYSVMSPDFKYVWEGKVLMVLARLD